MNDEALRRYAAQMAEARKRWPAGPWSEEPDRVEWRSHGFPCLIVRANLGHLCGYVAVPPGHPAHGKEWGAVSVNVHGGLTLATACDSVICHVPRTGEREDVWWLGFDCCHLGGGDLSPAELGLAEYLHEATGTGAAGYVHSLFAEGTYKTIAYVTVEVESLAEQLAAMRGSEWPGA